MQISHVFYQSTFYQSTLAEYFVVLALLECYILLYS